MIRVGIIGSENSHAAAFTRQFNQSGLYGDIRVVGLWGEDEAANQAQCREFDVACLRPEEMMGRVDAVMVTSRRGDLHLPYVRSFLQKGMPVFVDKPFTMSIPAAKELLNQIEQYGSPCVGGSSTRMVEDTLTLQKHAREGAVNGFVYAPVSLTNEYGNFWFYASHLCEIALTIFGYDPINVYARQTGAGISAILGYENFSASLGFSEGVYAYGATVVTHSGAYAQEIDISHCYDAECREFAQMLHSGQTPQKTEELAAPVYLMAAIQRSIESGKAEMIYVG